MEKIIKIAELLKGCPKGMELDCTMFEDVYFDCVDELNIIHCYIQHETHKTSITFNQHGAFNSDVKSKCVIFPKGKTTWNGFQRPFEDGDILATDLGSVFFLNTRLNTDECYGCYVGIGGDGYFYICDHFAYKECCGLATEEEKAKLFQALKDNDYKWDEETKTLEKLIKPKFKVGDRIKSIISSIYYTVVDIKNNNYFIKSDTEKYPYQISFENEIYYKLASNKFDITTLKPFDEVLVRNTNKSRWWGQFYMTYDENEEYPFECTYDCWKQCIPYEGNEHLLDTTNDCDDFYKTW